MTNIKTIKKALGKRKPYVPKYDDPAAQLRVLVQQHQAATKAAVSIVNMTSDRVIRMGPRKGEHLPCRIPNDAREELLAVADGKFQQSIAELERHMLIELKKLPIYQKFLANVFGVGPVTSAYLCSMIDMSRNEKLGGATKPSSVIRYCGLAVIDGKLERYSRGKPAQFNRTLRTSIYVGFASMWKVSARRTYCEHHANIKKATDPGLFAAETATCGDCLATDAPFGFTTKYLEIWRNKKFGVLSRAPGADGKSPSKGQAHSAGWHVAARVFIEDLYIIWRALEGLPVWPSYHAAKLGYGHGGKIVVNEPRLLTVDQAIELVGDVGKRRAAGSAVELEEAAQ